MVGITLGKALGMGDKLQFSSFPENYFRNTGEKVIDLDCSWIFDHNPFVVRGQAPGHVLDLWAAPWRQKVSPVPPNEFFQKPVFFSQADRTCSIFNHMAYLRHPRLYINENEEVLNKRVVVHTTGARLAPIQFNEGEDRKRVLPEEIIAHIKRSFSGWEILQVGLSDDLDAGVTDCRGADIWEVVRLISRAAMFIGVDSGPSWIAACYPKIFKKKVLVQYPPEFLAKSFVPMHLLRPHQHWHDSSFLYFNRTLFDAGVTYSYLKL